MPLPKDGVFEDAAHPARLERRVPEGGGEAPAALERRRRGAALLASSREAYWMLNGPGGEQYLKALGLKPPTRLAP